MDNIRNIISNLYIYQEKDYSNSLPLLSNNNSSSKMNKYYYNNISNIYKNSELENNFSNPINVSHYKYCEYCRGKDNESQNNSPIKLTTNYYTIKDDYFQRKNINYIKKNKDYVREQEYKMREERLRQENEALKFLLFNSRPKRNYSVNPRLYDYLKNQKVKFNLLKGQRAQSSKVILEKREGDYSLEKNGSLKYFSNLYNSVKLPKINNPEVVPIKDSFSYLNSDKNKKKILLKINENNNQIMNKEYKSENEDEKNIEKENNKLPRNMRILSEEEKNDRIKDLTYLKKELEDELFQFPIARLSNKQKERKTEIEKNLYNIDEELIRLNSLKVIVVKI